VKRPGLYLSAELLDGAMTGLARVFGSRYNFACELLVRLTFSPVELHDSYLDTFPYDLQDDL
jgi:hypothetical protein